MHELKFKLKKDGKCVGYMRIGSHYRPDTIDVSSCTLRGEWFGGCPLPGSADSIHPFVCQDRDGKDVYCGDRTQYRGSAGVIGWCQKAKGFVFFPDGKDTGHFFVDSEIALLPDEAWT